MHEIKFVYKSPSCSTLPDNIGETDNTSPLTALSDDTDIPAAQRSCPTSRTPLNILTLVLCQTVMSPHGKSFLRATMVDGRLHHLHTPRHKNKHKVHPVRQQLWLPQTLRDDVVAVIPPTQGSRKNTVRVRNKLNESTRFALINVP